MHTGELVAGRWSLTAEAPGESTIARWRAVDPATGDPVEVLSLRESQRPNAAAKRRFEEIHRNLLAARDPGLVTTIEVADTPALRVVRQPLEDTTLAELRTPLSADVATWIGARIAPAILAAGPAASALTLADIGLDAEGAPVLAPRGRPVSRVNRALLRTVAPEVLGGAPPDGTAGLYSLGALLYALITGKQVPPSGRPPPPSAIRHGITEEVDAAILGLLDEDRAVRPGSAARLAQLAGGAMDLRELAEATPGAALMVVPSRPVQVSRGAAIVIDGKTLAGMSPAERAAAAGWARSSIAWVDNAAEDRRPIVIEWATNTRAAARRARALEAESGLPLRVVAPPILAPWTYDLQQGALAATTMALATAALLTAWTVVFLPLAVAALIPMFVVLALGRRAREAARVFGQGQQPSEKWDQGPWPHLHLLRRELGSADIPDAIAVDLRSALREVDGHLSAHEAIATRAREALDRVDLDQLRTRIANATNRATTDPEAAAERDRLVRIAADLEEVEARYRRTLTSSASVERVLLEVETSLAELRARQGPTANPLRQIGAAARALRDLVDPEEEP